jgi:hypothetical protein
MQKRQLEKDYLRNVLTTQIEGKRLKGEKRIEVLSNLLQMNKLPYKISNYGKSNIIINNKVDN